MHTPTILTGASALLSALLLVAASAANAAATAEPMDLDADLLSKLALERAKSSGSAKKGSSSDRRASDGLSNPAAECGSIGIGNVITGGRPGFQPREVTVVITGDVINANNRCR